MIGRFTYRYQNSTYLNGRIDPKTNSGGEGSLDGLVKGFTAGWSFDLKQCVVLDRSKLGDWKNMEPSEDMCRRRED